MIKTKTLLLHASALAGIAVLVAAQWHINNLGYARWFQAAIALVAIVTAYFAFRIQYSSLRRTSGDEVKAVIAKKKLQAEIASGLAVLAFIGLYFRAGYEMDVRNIHARVQHIALAETSINSQMTDTFCNQTGAFAYRNYLCKKLKKDMSDAAMDLLQDDERNAHKAIDDAVGGLRLRVMNDRGVPDQSAISEAVTQLEAAELDDDIQLFLFESFQLLLLIAAIYAVPRKIAIAKYEHDRATTTPIAL